jgi:magnesium chelatase family protein
MVIRAREHQKNRFANLGILTNVQMNSRQVRQICKLDEDCQNMIKQAVYELGLSARAHDKILKISRTIADLEDSDSIRSHHVAEAIQYRRLDRNL